MTRSRFNGQDRFGAIDFVASGGGKIYGDRVVFPTHWQRPARAAPAHGRHPQTAVVYTPRGCLVSDGMCDLSDSRPVQHDCPAVGIDVGLRQLETLSTDEVVANPRWHGCNASGNAQGV